MPYRVVERVPIEAYLRKSYEPDSDYVDGEVRERCCGLMDHSRMMGSVMLEFGRRDEDWGMMTFPLLTVRVAVDRVRISEVCLIPRKGLKMSGIATTPPLVSVEIWQEDDVWEDQEERARDFLAMGVKGVWLIDPYEDVAYAATDEGQFVRQDVELSLVGTPIRLDLKKLFEDARSD